MSTRSLETVTFRKLQYHKTSCARCVVFRAVVCRLFELQYCAVRERAVTKEEIQKAREAFLRKVEDADEYDTFLWGMRENIERPKGERGEIK